VKRIWEIRVNGTQHDPKVAFAGLAEAIRKADATKFRFFTLNHDLLLEKYLKDEDIDYYRPIEPHPMTSAYSRISFSRKHFESAAVSLVKLHGSIDWWRIRPKKDREARHPFRREFIGIQHGKDKRFEKMDKAPRVLIGTFNKILRYSTHVFLPLLAELQYSLRESRRLIVCGYGFGDKGINNLVIDGMLSAKRLCMVVVDPEPFHPSRCRFAVLDKIKLWKTEKRLFEANGKIGANSITWPEILELGNVR